MSNVEIMKTKAETDIAAHFASVSGTLPADTVPLENRRAAMARFEELGLPHRRIEAWKYTDLRTALTGVAAPAAGAVSTTTPQQLETALGALASVDAYRAVFVNGRLDDELSRLPSITGVTLERVGEVAKLDERLSDESIVALNTAFATDGLQVEVASGATLDKPLMIVSLRTGADVSYGHVAP